MSQRFVIAFLLLCLFAGKSFGNNPDVSIKQLNHEKWTLKDSGPGEIGPVSQTKDGYLWVGSGYSLYRFDGLEFEKFENAQGLQIPTVSTLLATEEGGLWVGHRSGGATYIKGNIAKQYLPSHDGLPVGVVYGFAVDPSGSVWVATHEGLGRFDGEKWERIDGTLGFPRGSARSLLVDDRGVLWVASEARLYSLKPDSREFEEHEAELGWVIDMVQGPEGRIWIAERSSGRVRSFDASGRIGPILNYSASSLLFDRKGALWGGTQGSGLFRFDADDFSHRPTPQTTKDRMRRQDGLSGNVISEIFEDIEGNIWVGSNRGLDRFKSTVAVQSRFPAGMYNVALAASKNGEVWAGSSNYPVLQLTSGKLEKKETPGVITAAISDTAGQIWMAGPGGIWRSDAGNLKRVSDLPVEVPAEAAVRAMARDAQGQLWVSINRVGLFSLSNNQWKLSPAVSDLPRQTMPVIAATGPDGYAWFGYRDGLLAKRQGNRFITWRQEEGVTIGNVTALAFNDDRVWLGGQRGLAFSEGNRFRHLQVDDNGLLDGVHALFWDHEGDLWAHSFAGVIRIKGTDLAAFIDQAVDRVPIQWFSDIPKMPNAPYRIHPLPTAIRDPSGRLWFTSTEGVFWINPSRLQDESVTPKLLIKHILADNTVIEVDTANVEVPPGISRLDIVYAGLLLGAPQSLQFQHRLIGYDNTWRNVGMQGHSIYTGLGPGKYRFEVRTVSQYRGASSGATSLEFTVKPFFYQTWLFLGLCGLASVALVWGVYVLRFRFLESNLRSRLEERHKERERIARELHDTLLQAFQGLQLQFHAIANQLEKTSPLHGQMERALDRADEALVDARDRVNDLRAAKIMQKDLENDLISYAKCLEGENQTKFNVKTTGTKMPLDSLVLDELYWIAREAMLNAHQHASASRVDVLVEYGMDGLSLRIRDNGAGLPPSYRKQNGLHWGIRGMRERAQRIGADFELESTERGTQVIVRLAGGKSYRQDVSRVPRLFRLFVYRRR